MESDGQRCRVCGQLFEVGSNGVCRPCRRAGSKIDRLRRGKPRRRTGQHLLCDCGQPAVAVKVVRVGLDGAYQARLPLCADCLRLEQGEDPA